MRKKDDPKAWADTLPSQFGPYDSLPPGAEPVEASASRPPAPPAPNADGAPAAHAGAAPTAGAAATASPAAAWPWHRWVREGLRAAVGRVPALPPAAPGPWQVLGLVMVPAALLLAVDRARVLGPAGFDVRVWLAPWWTSLLLLWAAWWAMAPRQSPSPWARRGGLAAWLVYTSWAPLPATALLYGLMAWQARAPEAWASDLLGWVSAGMFGLLLLWVLAVFVRTTAVFAASRGRTVGFALVLVASLTVASWLFPETPWYPRADATAALADEPAPAPPLRLSPEVFEDQQALWQAQVQALAPERPGVTDVYALVFSPYADEEVFRRESSMVARLMEERFDARGRVLHLLNHAETAATHPWATPANLHRAVAALAQRMDREHDVLFVYLTSHGARNHELAASLAPLEIAPLTPRDLREALDAAGVRHRVVAVSACYSGGWLEPVYTPGTLVMTAADADHTSYGCGRLSELTFFGRAVFDEQLRQTHSFTEAFEQAVPVIARRELDAGKADGFSNPQMRLGPDIAPVLQGLQQRLTGL